MKRVLVAFGWNSSILSSKGRNSFSLSVSRSKREKFLMHWGVFHVGFFTLICLFKSTSWQADTIWMRLTNVFDKNNVVLYFWTVLFMWSLKGLHHTTGRALSTFRWKVAAFCICFSRKLFFSHLSMPVKNSNKAALYLGNSKWKKVIFTNQFLNKQLKYRVKTVCSMLQLTLVGHLHYSA